MISLSMKLIGFEWNNRIGNRFYFGNREVSVRYSFIFQYPFLSDPTLSSMPFSLSFLILSDTEVLPTFNLSYVCSDLLSFAMSFTASFSTSRTPSWWRNAGWINSVVVNDSLSGSVSKIGFGEPLWSRAFRIFRKPVLRPSVQNNWLDRGNAITKKGAFPRLFVMKIIRPYFQVQITFHFHRDPSLRYL